MFTPGTFISTERGQRPIELLRKGDRVVTRAHGLKRVVWTGRCDFSYHDLTANNDLRPVLIKKGALGRGRPERDMLVSPQHKFAVRGQEVLIPARALIDHQRIVPAPSLGVSYLHMLFNSQAVIMANGAWADCLHPDDAPALPQVDLQRKEVLAMFPQIATMGAAKPVKKLRKLQEERSRFET
ncbi:MAG: Hint domain-containing protein [Paracoccaceae bacterium]